MGTGYIRQSVSEIQPGVVVAATPLNNELNQIQAAMAGGSGHAHDGTTGNGPRISILDTTGTLTIARGGTGATVSGGAALAGLAGFDSVTGGLYQTGTTTFAKRVLTAGSAKISVTNGNGVSGNPTIDLGLIGVADIADAGSMAYQDSDEVTLSGGIATGVTFQDYGETVQTVAAATTTNIDIEDGNVVTLTQNVDVTTLNFNNPNPTGIATNLTIIRVKDNSGTTRNITWPTSVDWNKGTAPVLSTTANAVDIFTFLTVDGGTRWYGFIGGTTFA